MHRIIIFHFYALMWSNNAPVPRLAGTTFAS